MRLLPDTGVERGLRGFVSAIESWVLVDNWTGGVLQRALLNGGLEELERTWSNLVALEYAVLIQTWKAAYEQNSTLVADSWAPQLATLTGTQPKLFARLRINVPQLIVGGIATLLLTLATLMAIHYDSPEDHDTVIRDGGVLDAICLLEGSSLPDIIAGPVSVDEAKDVNTVRRKRAEHTMVA